MSKIKDIQKATVTTEEKYVKISWSNALDKVYAQKKKKWETGREGRFADLKRSIQILRWLCFQCMIVIKLPLVILSCNTVPFWEN